MIKHYPPVFNNDSFNCPYCNVFAKQNWFNIFLSPPNSGFIPTQDIKISQCSHCEKNAYWHKEKLILPNVTLAPPSHVDMPTCMVDDYNEASSILYHSPRGAAALLRLALQKLMVELGQPGKDINKDIGTLVKNGLPVEIQRALDILRVIGNESVHPGTMDLKDNREIALKLFELINFIIEDRISKPKKIEELFNNLPPGKLEGIAARDTSK